MRLPFSTRLVAPERAAVGLWEGVEKGEGREGKVFARPITRPGVDKLTVDCGIQDGASSGNIK